MAIQDTNLFQAIGAKMDYLNQRQAVISQNIANSDTPGYRPKDLEKADFSTILGKELGGPIRNVSIAATDVNHLPKAMLDTDARSRDQRDTYEVAPVGNAVIMEEQLINAGQNSMDYNMMINVYQKQVSMLETALGR